MILRLCRLAAGSPKNMSLSKLPAPTLPARVVVKAGAA